MNSRILVIGGGGFIGSSLSNKLCAQGNRVHVCGRSNLPKFVLDKSITYHSIDYDLISLADYFSNYDCIFDLAYATTPSVSNSNISYDLLENLPTHLNFFNSSLKAGVKKFIYVSSGGTVYGEHGNTVLDESIETKPISPYGITKLTLEKYAYMYFSQHNFPVIIVRPSNPYGINQLNSKGQGFVGAVYQAIKNSSKIDIFGETGTIRDYIYIDDLIDGLVSIMSAGSIGEIYNIGSSVGINNLDLVEIISKQLNSDIPKYNLLPKRPFDVKSNILSIEKIHTETGWFPKYDILTGLQNTFISEFK